MNNSFASTHSLHSEDAASSSSTGPIYDLPQRMNNASAKLNIKQISKNILDTTIFFSMFYRLLIIVLGSVSHERNCTSDDAVFIQDHQVKTTSLKVAELFNKQHKDVYKN